VGRQLAPLRQAAKRAYVPPQYTDQDVEDMERELYGVEMERRGVAASLEDVGRRLKDSGVLNERGLRGKSATQQARHVQELRNRNRGVGKGYTSLDSHGDMTEQGTADLLRQRAELLAHERHLRDEERQLTVLRRTLVRAVERGGAMSQEERMAVGWARQRGMLLGRSGDRQARRAGVR
jgi:hypothetical protein